MWSVSALLSATIAVAQFQGPPRAAPDPNAPDEAVVAFLRDEGLQRSEVMEHLSWMCDVYGPRLTGSPNMRRAQEWAASRFTEWGLSNVRLEEWGPFGRGWRLDHFHMDVVGENPWPVLAWPKAWCSSTNGEVVGEVVLVADLTAEQVAALDLEGRIVLMESARDLTEPFEARAKKLEAQELLDLADGRRPARPGGPPAQEGPPAAGNPPIAGATPAGAPPAGAAAAGVPPAGVPAAGAPAAAAPAAGAPAANAPAEGAAAPNAPGANPAAAAAGEQGRPGGERDGGRFSSFRRRLETMRAILEKKPLAILDRGSKGDYGTIFVQSASVPFPMPPTAGGPGAAPAAAPAGAPAAPPAAAPGAAPAGAPGALAAAAPAGAPAAPDAAAGPPGDDARAQRFRGPRPWSADAAPPIPQCTLAVEHYNRIVRLLKKGVPVRISLRLDATFVDGAPMERNVTAELSGADPVLRDEVVMLGGHYDSWHASTGATDNGAGCAVVMEAMRLLKKLAAEKSKPPRRTIRAALWSGEEQGLLGSRAYVEQHFGTREQLKDEHARFSAYYNLDNGTGRIRGVYLQGNEACAPIFRSWLRPFHDLGASTLTINNTGGTDHQSFDGVGLPGFQFIQDPAAYDAQTHHSSMDSWDHAIADDLKQAATIMASFAWHTAQRDEKLPRKPAPPPPPQSAPGAPTGAPSPVPPTGPTQGGPTATESGAGGR